MRLVHTALSIAAALLPGMAATAASASTPDRFDIGGRSIHLVCQGEGEPTVVLDAGMGTAPAEDAGWRRIAARIASRTRVCLYDRAGLGGSDPAPEPRRTSADAADDLDRALSAAQIKPPFVLVGHSIGGLHAQVFAGRYPGKVAALVLVSSTHPDQMRIWRDILPPPSAADSKPLVEARRFLTVMESDPSQNPERLDMLVSGQQARSLKSLGEKPIMVLTQSPKWRMAPGLDEDLAVMLETASQSMQKEFLSLSSNARQWIALDAGHGLPHEDPELVVAGVLEALRAARDQSRERRSSAEEGPK